MGPIADIAVAMAAIPDHELRSLRAAVDSESVIVPSLSAWLEALTGWEMARRAGSHREPPAPRASGDRSEVECSLVALAILHVSFRNVDHVANFLDVAAEALWEGAGGSSKGPH